LPRKRESISISLALPLAPSEAESADTIRLNKTSKRGITMDSRLRGNDVEVGRNDIALGKTKKGPGFHQSLFISTV
jgi:hypothetical protein